MTSTAERTSNDISNGMQPSVETAPHPYQASHPGHVMNYGYGFDQYQNQYYYA